MSEGLRDGVVTDGPAERAITIAVTPDQLD
jgi:hypothetical protein